MHGLEKVLPPNNEFSFTSDPDDYMKYQNNLYVKNTGGDYQKVELTSSNEGSWISPKYVYTYTFPDKSTVTSSGGDSVPNFGDKGPLYYRTEVPGEGTYTYTYTPEDSNAGTGLSHVSGKITTVNLIVGRNKVELDMDGTGSGSGSETDKGITISEWTDNTNYSGNAYGD